MRRLTSFTFQSIDGFFKGPDEDISWNRHGPEEIAFSEAQLARGDTLVFGRRTYDHMADFWPTPAAAAHLPAIAGAMNRAEKIVVSNSLREALWGPARIIGGDVAGAFRSLKAGDGPDMTILGSAELVTCLAAEGLIDALEIMIYPVVIGAGTSLFAGLSGMLDFTLTDHRAFNSGTVLLTYAPDGSAS
ncbi:dihydrofolate reductase family protein [uncultured Paracoccus sp.]|uniref:dihydrofolate reductase family protein n=1 Tax=uncultured Paracoccus sp. TaxID=189685 RepID=UPI0026095ADD|nr:dihydrofolate reductase family protein [uncultured Paracoccus sp.]